LREVIHPFSLAPVRHIQRLGLVLGSPGLDMDFLDDVEQGATKMMKGLSV